MSFLTRNEALSLSADARKKLLYLIGRELFSLPIEQQIPVPAEGEVPSHVKVAAEACRDARIALMTFINDDRAMLAEDRAALPEYIVKPLEPLFEQVDAIVEGKQSDTDWRTRAYAISGALDALKENVRKQVEAQDATAETAGTARAVSRARSFLSRLSDMFAVLASYNLLSESFGILSALESMDMDALMEALQRQAAVAVRARQAAFTTALTRFRLIDSLLEEKLAKEFGEKGDAA